MRVSGGDRRRSYSHRVDWPCGTVRYAIMPPHHPSDFTSTSQPIQIGVSFTGHLKAVRQTGERLHEEDVRPSAALITTRAPVTWLRVTEPSECIEIFPEPRTVSEVSDGRIGSLDAIGIGHLVEDPIIASIATLMRRAALASTQVGDLEGDALIHRLVKHVVYTYSGFRRPEHRAVRGGISLRTMRVLTDYVESHLAERITLGQLAALAAREALDRDDQLVDRRSRRTGRFSKPRSLSPQTERARRRVRRRSQGANPQE